MAAEEYSKEREVDIGYNAHTADYETDVKYFIDPENVDKSKAVKEMSGLINKDKYMYWDIIGSGPAFRLLKYKYYTKSGVPRDATKSKAEKGQKCVNITIDNIAAFIEDVFKKMEYPEGIDIALII